LTVKIVLNGKEIELAEECTVERLLDEHPPAHRGFAVELNRAVVPRKEHARRLLRPGDRVEVVTLVGGG
jgi:thiamine biosynthesis protein ThiS